MLFHTEYSRFQALEIIRENEYQVNRSSGESEGISNQCADAIYRFYSKSSNAVLEGCLEDIYGQRPVIKN